MANAPKSIFFLRKENFTQPRTPNHGEVTPSRDGKQEKSVVFQTARQVEKKPINNFLPYSDTKQREGGLVDGFCRSSKRIFLFRCV